MYIYVYINGGVHEGGSERHSTRACLRTRPARLRIRLFVCLFVHDGATDKALGGWPLHDLVITNIVWCIAYKREVARGVIYCPIIVQLYCTRVGNAGGRGE